MNGDGACLNPLACGNVDARDEAARSVRRDLHEADADEARVCALVYARRGVCAAVVSNAQVARERDVRSGEDQLVFRFHHGIGEVQFHADEPDGNAARALAAAADVRDGAGVGFHAAVGGRYIIHRIVEDAVRQQGDGVDRNLMNIGVLHSAHLGERAVCRNADRAERRHILEQGRRAHPGACRGGAVRADLNRSRPDAARAGKACVGDGVGNGVGRVDANIEQNTRAGREDFCDRGGCVEVGDRKRRGGEFNRAVALKNRLKRAGSICDARHHAHAEAAEGKVEGFGDGGRIRRIGDACAARARNGQVGNADLRATRRVRNGDDAVGGDRIIPGGCTDDERCGSTRRREACAFFNAFLFKVRVALLNDAAVFVDIFAAAVSVITAKEAEHLGNEGFRIVDAPDGKPRRPDL